ncbi:hypothetical protein CLCR_11069 [Cladophialophora carrionii]|uniref:Uncharacterized protein n=1 Tax=Cladophialophora carrionii TaxID=86049 RepID=A0A1C1CVR9_9EURO|nr:hypothetical protein CLCR_11069 [Cladophialophora carrionii]
MSANMFSRRALQLTQRRPNPSTLGKTPLSRLSAPAAIATSQNVQIRSVLTSLRRGGFSERWSIAKEDKSNTTPAP